MIKVTRLNGTETVINAELIESVEGTPDTVISLTTGHRYVVQESVDEVVARVLAYRKACCRSLDPAQRAPEADPMG
ncbi:MAG: flagellar FlbD family protein [Armatimonadota bacterium]|nr:flagellar FlbD family protein [Armatimonadota bacterium]MDR7444882.1 flagellar FlbD family protein [Armatimonadota bacterium]MDR7569101.1 flagellar FlbD family protein [Armatimonadota bacterium]MDR7613453.1 flagellar FlbD family protein [Armatimonadota bacterium]